jgi:hypothetical protein
MTPKYCILMADVIQSSDKDGNEVMKELKNLVASINKSWNSSFLSPLTITLGDEFQAIVKSLQDGIHVLFALEENRLTMAPSLKLRYVLHLGTIDTPVNPEYAHEMLGQGLTMAREQIESLKKSDHRIHFDVPGQLASLMNDGFFLYASIVDRWKPKDYRLISAFLEGMDYYELAKRFNKNKGYTWRKKKSLEISQYFSIKNLISNLVEIC